MGKPKFNPLRDVVSGAIMAATSVPQLIAYAELVGYAGYRGLETAGLPLVAWGLVTGSPYMTAGVTSLSALMTKTDLDGDTFLKEHSEQEYIALVAAYSFYIGLASILLAVIGIGRLAQKVPTSVRSGFKWGCAYVVLVSALPNGLFANGSSQLKEQIKESDVWNHMIGTVKTQVPLAAGTANVLTTLYALAHPWQWSFFPTMVFLICAWFIMHGKKLLPKSFPPGSEVALSTGLATVCSIQFHYPGAVVGEIPVSNKDDNGAAGIPFFGGLRLPIDRLNSSDIFNAPLVDQFGGNYVVLGLSTALFASVNFLLVVGIASGFEVEDGISWNAPREMIAQGISCIVAAWVGSAPVSGSMSRSLVSRMTGTTSQFACIVTAILWITMLPYMSIMTPTPKAALSSVIVSAVAIGVVRPKDLLQLNGIDAIIGWGTGIVTVLSSPTIGFGIGIVLYASLKRVEKTNAVEGKCNQ